MTELNDLIDTVLGYLSQGFENLKHNAEHYASMSLKEWVRIVTIVGAYLLLRPYLSQWAAKLQSAEHDKEIDADELATPATGPKAAISANSLRGQVKVPEDSESDEDTGEAVEATAQTTSANWGKKARKRQRAMIKRIIEADEKLRAETEAYDDEEDKDIEQYLT
ncbi:hypothetical protein V501_06348 [Pseudogymnoascus sp. VKM F-4519 (FW-2642)]|jgi:hypothetical protein|nr:hypothetical protein V501_06348 [Pseudogymnoascus sp. VKM F-4519 (FW-2642)]